MRVQDPTGGRSFCDFGDFLVHVPSGLRFRDRVATFRREPVPTVHGEMGYHLVVSYHRLPEVSNPDRTDLTVSIGPGHVPAEGAASALPFQFEGMKFELRSAMPSASLLYDQETVITAGRSKITGRRAKYKVEEAGALLEIYLFRLGIWRLECRISHFGVPSNWPARSVRALIDTLTFAPLAVN